MTFSPRAPAMMGASWSGDVGLQFSGPSQDAGITEVLPSVALSAATLVVKPARQGDNVTARRIEIGRDVWGALAGGGVSRRVHNRPVMRAHTSSQRDVAHLCLFHWQYF